MEMLTFLYQPVYCEFEILTLVTLKSDFYWDVILCGLVDEN